MASADGINGAVTNFRRSELDGEADFKSGAVTFAGLEADRAVKNPTKFLHDSQPAADAGYIVACGPLKFVEHAAPV
jgi:hypothetical protein